MLGELRHEADVALDGVGGMVTQLHVLDQPLSQGSHGGHRRAGGNRDRTRSASILTARTDQAQDRIIVTTGTTGLWGARATSGAAWDCSPAGTRLNARGCNQQKRRSLGGAHADREHPRSGLVRLGFIPTVAGSRLMACPPPIPSLPNVAASRSGCRDGRGLACRRARCLSSM